MPLRDHFRPPLDNARHWEGFHATWPVMMVGQLTPKLPQGYFAEPRVHSGATVEVDVATFEEEERSSTSEQRNGNDGVATAVWSPPQSTLKVSTDLPDQDVYEVRIFDEKRNCTLVAAVEIVSPANKDRPEHRRAFISKCAGLLREHVSVVIVDVVTTRTRNLYEELLDHIGVTDPSLGEEPPPLYTASCRMHWPREQWELETWSQPLQLGQALPTMPLWLTEDLAVPLDLEASYQQGCQLLNLPT